MGEVSFDSVYYNTRPIPKRYWERAGSGKPVQAGAQEKNDPRFIPASFADFRILKQDAADVLIRTLIRHNGARLAQLIWNSL